MCSSYMQVNTHILTSNSLLLGVYIRCRTLGALSMDGQVQMTANTWLHGPTRCRSCYTPRPALSCPVRSQWRRPVRVVRVRAAQRWSPEYLLHYPPVVGSFAHGALEARWLLANLAQQLPPLRNCKRVDRDLHFDVPRTTVT